jgi:hypothetical protein
LGNDGAFHLLQSWDAEAVMTLFREGLLARLVERHAISEDLARKLVAWKHPGFSSHLADPIPFENKKAIEDLACYLVRAPLSLQKLVYLDGQQAVLYRSRMNPSLGRNFEAMDPLEWLARLADHIPDPGRHRTHFYAHYANRVRGERPDEEAGRHADDREPTTRRRCSHSWARLLAKVFQVDPLVCRRCAGPLKVVAYITDSLAIRQILEHLDLSPPEKPPPDIREVVHVPVDEEGRETCPRQDTTTSKRPRARGSTRWSSSPGSSCRSRTPGVISCATTAPTRTPVAASARRPLPRPNPPLRTRRPRMQRYRTDRTAPPSGAGGRN